MCRSQQLPPCLGQAWTRGRLVPVAILVLLALLAPVAGQAQTYGDAAEGQRLAATWCGDCHRVGTETRKSASDAVPSFAAIAAMPSTTAMSIRAFLSTSHPVMPNFTLTDKQISDVGSYILSLRAPRPE